MHAQKKSKGAGEAADAHTARAERSLLATAPTDFRGSAGIVWRTNSELAEAAVDHQTVAGVIGRQRAHQVYGNPAEIPRISEAAHPGQRDQRADLRPRVRGETAVGSPSSQPQWAATILCATARLDFLRIQPTVNQTVTLASKGFKGLFESADELENKGCVAAFPDLISCPSKPKPSRCSPAFMPPGCASLRFGRLWRGSSGNKASGKNFGRLARERGAHAPFIF